MTTTSQSRTSIYWITTILSAAAFIIPGLGNLLRMPHFVEDMTGLGYPTYFMSLLGAWKIIGAITILLPKLKRAKEWAYAGMLIDLTGAAFSRISSHHAMIMAIIPLLIACVVIASWFLRPESRRL